MISAPTARATREPQAVGADDEPGVDLQRGAGAVMAVHAGGATGIVEVYPGDRDAEPHVGAGRGGRLGHEGVEDVATRRDEQVHARLVLDRPGRRLALDGEGDLPDGGRSAVEHRLEQPPAVQLHHAGAGDLVRRERVRREDGAVDQDDVVSEPGQQQRGGGAGGAGAHDDDVVAVAVGWHGEFGSRSAGRDRGGDQAERAAVNHARQRRTGPSSRKSTMDCSASP